MYKRTAGAVQDRAEGAHSPADATCLAQWELWDRKYSVTVGSYGGHMYYTGL